MGAPAQLNLEQEGKLKALSSGKPDSETTIDVKNGTWVKNISLDQNDIYFIKLNLIGATK
jgi:hypothetical protein